MAKQAAKPAVKKHTVTTTCPVQTHTTPRQQKVTPKTSPSQVANTVIPLQLNAKGAWEQFQRDFSRFHDQAEQFNKDHLSLWGKPAPSSEPSQPTHNWTLNDAQAAMNDFGNALQGRKKP